MTEEQQKQPETDVKTFSQEAVNAIIMKENKKMEAKFQEMLKAERQKWDDEKALEGMAEVDRLKAEKEKSDNQLLELQKQVDFNNRKSEALNKLTETKLDNRYIDVLMSDKSNEEKIDLLASIQKEVVDKAIKDAMPAHNPQVGDGTATNDPFLDGFESGSIK